MRYLFLLFATVLLFLSCGEDTIIKEIEESEEGVVQVSVFYTEKDNPNVKHPDAESKVYFYLGRYSTDFSNCSYGGEGKIVRDRDGSVVLPDISETADSKGELTIKMEDTDIPFTILVESNFYRRTTVYSYSQSKKKSVFTVIFNP